MTQDTAVGQARRYAFLDLDMRLEADHCNLSFHWKDMVLRCTDNGEQAPFRMYSINDHLHGCRYLGFTIPRLSVEHCRAFIDFMPQFQTELSEVEVFVPSGSNTVSTTELPWSNRLVIYTDSTTASKSDILTTFQTKGLEALLIDNEEAHPVVPG